MPGKKNQRSVAGNMWCGRCADNFGTDSKVQRCSGVLRSRALIPFLIRNKEIKALEQRNMERNNRTLILGLV